MNDLIHFWKILYIVGIGLFYITVAVIIPLGLKELVILLRDLKNESSAPEKKQ